MGFKTKKKNWRLEWLHSNTAQADTIQDNYFETGSEQNLASVEAESR
jgi:hypothetical protein